ncbi:hypothetical protein [Actinacidiphila sp. ITFR-21]|uniref:hypothetical protein n=1 Tax=Actinacidiphila sp. ITFR-21 TaxID=3075199 RepID=UPI00288922DC|nr:hypothetical protein [Streptomyces sp. ITFR-21]WNI15727.1 hypothetical protein RLT57_09450 [Streptomyces sp. ITFR-21]
MNTRLTPQQAKALESYAADGYAAAHVRTKAALVGKGLLEPVMGWVEKSIARRVGRYFATEIMWGVVGYRITAAGRDAINVPCQSCRDGRIQQVTGRGHVISLPCPHCTTGGEGR